MDFSLGSIGVSGGFNNSNGSSNAGDRSLVSSAENRHYRIHSISDTSPCTAELLQSNSSCRSVAETHGDVESREEQMLPALKLARTDSPTSRWPQPELKMQAMYAPGAPGLMIRHSPMQSDARNMLPAYSPTCSRASDDTIFGGDLSRFAVDQSKLLKGDHMMTPALTLLGSTHSPSLRSPSFFQESYAQHRPSGIPVMLGREAAAIYHGGLGDPSVGAVGGRGSLFTASQWAELELQALIYKYMMRGSTVPAELLLPIRRSVAAMRGSPHNMQLGGGWGGISGGLGGNVDPEPGRCRRTDGKKWRCARPVVPEQKYCERHVHRGRHRKKAAAEAQNNSASNQGANGSAPSPTLSTVAIRDNPSPGLGNTHQSNHTSLKPSMVLNPHQPQVAKSLTNNIPAISSNVFNPSSHSAASLSAACNQFSLPLHSQSGLPENRDNRFLSHDGISKAHFDLRPEQLLSDFSATSRGLNPIKALNSAQLPASYHHLAAQWHLQQQQQQQLSRMPPFGLRSCMNAATGGSFLQDGDHQMKCMQIQMQETLAMAETNGLAHLFKQQQQQQHTSFVDNTTIPMKPFSTDSKCENQPLRHFFDDWPRTRDASTLSWSDDDKPKAADGSSTQLSISIARTSSSDISPSESPSRKTTLFAQKLSSLGGCEDMADPPTDMGLGINLNLLHKSSWFSPALDKGTGVGGPLGEVLQSSTPLHPHQTDSLSSLKEDWDSHSHNAAPHNSSCTASPTGVLQKPPLGCFSSDSGSNASSPGSVRTEQPTSDNHRSPALMKAPSRLAPT